MPNEELSEEDYDVYYDAELVSKEEPVTVDHAVVTDNTIDVVKAAADQFEKDQAAKRENPDQAHAREANPVLGGEHFN